MRNIIIPFAFILVLATSCVTLISPKNQYVIIVTNNPKAEVYLDTTLVGKGDTVVTYIPKDALEKQFKVLKDSCKPKNFVMLPYRYDPFLYLNFFTFLGFLIDYDSPKIKLYDSYFTVDTLSKYRYHTTEQKKISKCFVTSNLKMRRCKMINWEGYYKYVKYPGNPDSQIDLDSNTFDRSKPNEIIRQTLIKTHFMDAAEPSVTDSINSFQFGIVIENAALFRVMNALVTRTSTFNSNFTELLIVGITTRWVILNLKGDTIYTDVVPAYSDSFGRGENSIEKAASNCMDDAIEYALIAFMEKPKVIELLKKK
jgi:hypothetical protein